MNGELRWALAEVLEAHQPWYADGYLTGESGYFTCGRFDPDNPGCEWQSDPDDPDPGTQHRLHIADELISEFALLAASRGDGEHVRLDEFEIGANYDGQVWLYHDTCGGSQQLSEDLYERVPLARVIAEAERHLDGCVS